MLILKKKFDQPFMIQKGEFNIRFLGKTVTLPNTLCKSGAVLFLQSLFQGATVLPDNYYLGLGDYDYSFTTELTDLAATEPTNGGYARKAIPRNSASWTLTLVGNAYRATSAAVTFTATADYNKTWRQVFLCDAASGSSGTLFAVSGKYKEDIQTEADVPPTVDYTFYLRGLGSE